MDAERAVHPVAEIEIGGDTGRLQNLTLAETDAAQALDIGQLGLGRRPGDLYGVIGDGSLARGQFAIGKIATRAPAAQARFLHTSDLIDRVADAPARFLLVALRFEPAPLLLGFMLGPMMEENLRRALTLSRGDPTVFLREPISVVLLIAATGLLIVIILPTVQVNRAEVFAE